MTAPSRALTEQSRTHARRWPILAVLCLSVLLVAMDNTIVNVALPTLNRQFSTSTSDLQWVVDIYTVFFAGLLLVCGNIGDRVGRKRVLQVGLVLFAAASFASAHAGSVTQLVATRGAMGVAVALVYPSTLALLSTVFTDRQEKAVAVGVWSGVSGLAIALGPVLGGLLLQHFWWGSIFMINLPVIAVALILGARMLPESRDPSPGRFDGIGALLSISFTALLIWTIIEAPARGWTGPATVAGFVGSALLLAAFVWREAVHADPLLDISFFRNPRFSAASVTISIAFFALFGFIFMITMYFQLLRGYDTLKAGMATLPFAAIMGALSPVAILIVRRTGAKIIITAGMLLMAAGLLVAATAAATADYWSVVVVSMSLMATGMALATSPATDSILASLPEAKTGVGSAVNDTVRELGGALGVAVVGSVMSWAYSSHLADGWTRLGIPAPTVALGQASFGSGLATARQLPPTLGGSAYQAARDSFVHGFHAGSLTAAGAAVLAALAALFFLPQRDAGVGEAATATSGDGSGPKESVQGGEEKATAPSGRPEPTQMRSIRRLAIVNRGEPVMRVLAAVTELNETRASMPITTIVLYTDPDSDASFVRAADEACVLRTVAGADSADGRYASPYLDEAAVMDALRRIGADAVWVGWGFLSERASFAELCEDAGILFVGPDSTSMRLLGDKIAAKLLAEKADVPVIPWSGGPVEDLDEAKAAARDIGFPVMVKAASGGGGRGIRAVLEEDGLATAFTAARAEAQAAFGDPTVFLEKLLPAARHVEVQVIGDDHGRVWAPGLRDCSIQRKHQKIVEESASPGLDPSAEQAVIAAAVRLASAAGYRSTGTVEFLLDPLTGDYSFMEMNTRLQVEHPVTEATTGLDLAKLQLHVARGGRLDGEPPSVRGHAVEARICAEDPEDGFAPAPGRLALFTLPAGPGIRVETGMRQGDTVVPEFDSMIAKIIAWGADRDEALARLRRGLEQAVIVIEGGTTNLSFLRALLNRPEVLDGRADNQWLDRLTADGGHLPAADAAAVLVAAVEWYEADEAVGRAAFHARAARGRPAPSDEVGHRCDLRYRGARYALRTFRTGPDTYRVDVGGTLVDVGIGWTDGYQRQVEIGGRRHRVVLASHGTSTRVDIDGVAHRVFRDDGGIVRSGWPALVVSVRVAPGDRVVTGDPLMVVESMKMEATITAPFDGDVVAIEATPNTQIGVGDPLLRIRPGGNPLAGGVALDFRDLVLRGGTGTTPADELYADLDRYLLGYDLDPQAVGALVAGQRDLDRTTPPDDPGVLSHEDAFLDLFADVCSLYRPRAETEPDDALSADGTQEYLLSYLQWLDADRAGLPDHFRGRVERALLRYGIHDLTRTTALEEAVVWMFRSFSRLDPVAPSVTAVLERRLRHREALAPLCDTASLRSRLDRLASAAGNRHRHIADLAGDVRFRYLDEPVLAASEAAESVRTSTLLDALDAYDPTTNRAAVSDRLVASPQPMRGTLLRRWLTTEDDEARRTLLEIHTRRYYRIRDLHSLSCARYLDRLISSAEYGIDGRTVHLVVAYSSLADLPALAEAVAEHLAGTGVDPGHEVVVDANTWCAGLPADGDVLARELAELLERCDFGRRLHRLDLTVTDVDPATLEPAVTRHVTFRQSPDGAYAEERLYRDLHPMLAKRLDLWRLAEFDLTRLPSAEDVYLFHGVARDNPADRRLFALAEVRGLESAPGATGADDGVTLPRLTLLGLRALSAMRRALAAYPPRERPVANRIVFDVRPPWTVPAQDWLAVGRSFEALAIGADLDCVDLRVRIPQADGVLRPAVLHFEGVGGPAMTVREGAVGQTPVQSVTPYQQKVVRAQRIGAPYPYEIIRMLTPAPGTLTRFPTGRFAEYDLDDADELAPVEREPGLNTANVVVGLLTNETAEVPEGMTRVALLSDPTRGLGNLAEAECRRVIAALDLADRLRLPVEWFALSSGARIAMDSGTENMDWIGAVLRRIIEFTQAGGELNIVVTGVNVGAQPYWNAEATMLMHTRGILIMTPRSSMVLTGKHALDFSGGVSAEDNFGIGGFDRIMGPNGQGQYWAPTVEGCCDILLAHYAHTFVVPGETTPRRAVTTDPRDRDVRTSAHDTLEDGAITVVGDVFSAERNRDRKNPFDIRAVMRSVSDLDHAPLERWAHWREAETAVVWDTRLGGIPVCLLGVESHTLPRSGFVPADGPTSWSSGTLFPQSARKIARAVNAASGNRPVVILANLSGFDGSPESMRRRQLEFGAEIGRAITNFHGPIVFVVIGRYHGGAFVVFSKRLNDQLEIAAIEGSFASVIGGAPAAATVFAREVEARTQGDPRIRALRDDLGGTPHLSSDSGLRAELSDTLTRVRAEKLGEVADEFDRVHDIRRALAVGSVDRIIEARNLRPYLIDAVERGLSRVRRETEGPVA